MPVAKLAKAVPAPASDVAFFVESTREAQACTNLLDCAPRGYISRLVGVFVVADVLCLAVSKSDTDSPAPQSAIAQHRAGMTRADGDLDDVALGRGVLR